MARLDPSPKTVSINDLSHDGRGVARWPEGHAHAGKTVFVSGALPGETVSVQQAARSRHFDEAKTLEVLVASPDRVEPRCPHFGTCGGCALQHLEQSRQIHAKQRVLLENLERIGHVAPERVLPPLTDAAWGYRRKGRFSVRRVEKKDKTLVGFREQDPRFVADLRECHTVIPLVGERIAALSALVDGLDGRRDIPQIEFIAGDAQADFDGVALVFRHLQPLSENDRAKLETFAREHRFAIFLQPGGIDSVHPLWPADPQLAFRIPRWDIDFAFRPLDFIQVNAGLNEKMIALALAIASQLLTAFQTSLAYNEKNFGIRLQYKRIDPDYKSMGANFIQSDLVTYTIEPNFSLLKQTLRLGGSVGWQHDNLLDQKSATTKRTIGSVNLSYSPIQQYGLDIQFANYGVAQKAGIRPVNDTSKVAQANLNFNISNRLTLMNKIRVMNIMFIVTYQMLNDQNQYTSDYTESKVFFTNLSFSYSVLESGMSVNAGLAYSDNKMSAFKTHMIGPSAGISRDIIKKKLSGNANASYMLSTTNGSSSGGVFNATLGFNYRPYKKHSFNLTINIISNNSSISPDGTFTEFRFNLGYNFQLK